MNVSHIARAATTDRIVTELDHSRLQGRLRRLHAAQDEELSEWLDDAQVVPGRQVPADVVTMYSSVLLQEEQAGQPQKLTLCYPEDAEPAAGFVSILSPVGSALLGLPVGATACWSLPDGRQVRARVLQILFQPEASGDYTL